MNVQMDKSSIKKYVIEHLKESARRKLSSQDIDSAIDEAIKTCMNPLTISSIFVFNSFDLFCDKCGQCCRLSDPIWIQDEEIAVYSQYFGKNFDKFFVNRNKKWYFKNTKPCSFLASTGQCNIYNIRPAVCRGYPFNNIGRIYVTSKCKVPVNMAKQLAISITFRKILDREHPELKIAMENMVKIDEEKIKGMSPEELLDFGIEFNQIIKKKLTEGEYFPREEHKQWV